MALQPAAAADTGETDDESQDEEADEEDTNQMSMADGQFEAEDHGASRIQGLEVHQWTEGLENWKNNPDGSLDVVEAVEEHGEVLVLVLGHLESQLRHHQPQGDQGLSEVVSLGTRHPGQVSRHGDGSEQIFQTLNPRVRTKTSSM